MLILKGKKRELLRSVARIAKLNGFILFVAVGIYAFHRDRELAKIILIRSNLIMSLNILVLSGLSPFEIYEGVVSLPIPKGIKLLFLYLIKFVEILQREYSKLQEALEVRGFTPKTNLLTYKSYAFIIGNMLAKSLKRARDMYDAMVFRGFTGDVYLFRERVIGFADVLLVLSVLIQASMALALGVLR